MSDPTAAVVQSLIAFLAVLISAFSLWRTKRAEDRAIQASNRQIEIAEREAKVAENSVRPVLGLFSENFVGHLSVTLKNQGLGPAVVTKISYSKNEIAKESIPALVRPFIPFWNSYWKSSGGAIIAAGSEIDLVRLTDDVLRSARERSKDLEGVQISDVAASLKGILVHCEYVDLMDNVQEPLTVELDLTLS